MIKKFVTAILATLVVFLIAFVCFYFWLTTGATTPSKLRDMAFWHLPMAFVGGQPLDSALLLQRIEVADRMGQSTDINAEQNIYNDTILVKKEQEIAAQNNVFVTQQDIDDELSYMKDSGQGANLSQTLIDSGLDETDFGKQVVFPQVLEDKLRIWYNSQEGLNSQAYDTVSIIQSLLAKNADFQVLAGQYSQAGDSQFFGGDLGFVSLDSLFPEVKKPLTSAKSGDIVLIASREGLHLVKVQSISPDGQSYSLREIFIETTGFDQWLNQETNNIKVLPLFKL